MNLLLVSLGSNAYVALVVLFEGLIDRPVSPVFFIDCCFLGAGTIREDALNIQTLSPFFPCFFGLLCPQLTSLPGKQSTL